MVPWYLVILLVVAAFVAGALVYRNNAKKWKGIAKKALANIDDLAGISKR